MNNRQILPIAAGLAGDFARELALAKGPAYQPIDDPDPALASRDAHDDNALGAALAAAHATQQRALAQAFPDTATDTLPDWEQRYGLVVDPNAATAARQAALLAKYRAVYGPQPERILAAVRALAPEAVLHENTATGAAATDPRGVFLFAVVVSGATYDATATRALIRAVVEQMKPAHTAFTLGVGGPFRCGVTGGGRTARTPLGR